MKNKIEDKLLLLRAKKFADNLEGLDFFSIYPLDNDIFLWHREKLKTAYAIDNTNDKISLEQPVKTNEIIRIMASLLKIENKTSCWLVYEGRSVISACVNDFHSFLTSVFRLNKTYDISLLFQSPDRVISISDNEYDVDIYYEKNSSLE
ncbi:hypothetical protein CWR41_12580 [Cedecea lapagei]|jgi:hypothetical protein|nr:hypothetical protein CWR41_12580 [Cedecea lapagei]